MNFIP